tara:strand:- start:2832 stop:3422 length:591 start_codon:yes stop_codon:yes gene_type:complete
MSINENKIICSKKNILLTFNDNNKHYNLNFQTVTNNFNIEKYTNFNIYKLLFELNKDLIDSIQIINQISDNKANVLIIFKEIGENIKIPKNYLYLTVNKYYINKEILFESINNENISEIKNKISGCNRTTCQHSLLKITYNDIILTFNYDFQFNIPYQKSYFIDNIIALLIKKVFYKLKVFIENPISNYNDSQSIY